MSFIVQLHPTPTHTKLQTRPDGTISEGRWPCSGLTIPCMTSTRPCYVRPRGGRTRTKAFHRASVAVGARPVSGAHGRRPLCFHLKTASSPTEEVPPPAQATAVVIAAQRAIDEAKAHLTALSTDWDRAQRVKADSAAGEEAWHDADIVIEQLLKTIPRARITVRKTDREFLMEQREATHAYSEVARERWKTCLAQFVDQYLQPAYEAHQRLCIQRDQDQRDGVSEGDLPILAWFLLGETSTRQSALCEFLRANIHQGFYRADEWMPSEVNRDAEQGEE